MLNVKNYLGLSKFASDMAVGKRVLLVVWARDALFVRFE